MKNARRKSTGQEKMAILRRHLADKTPVSDVYDQAGINPTLFYRWQKELFEHGSAVFGRQGDDGQSRRLEEKLAAHRLVGWLGVGRSKYQAWKRRYGKVNEHNARVPRDHWLEDWEKRAIAAYARQHPGQGYRRLTYMMMDADVAAASPANVYRVLKEAGLMETWNRKPSKKGTGFEQPKSLKQECVRPASPLTLDDARRSVAGLVAHYNGQRLHSAVGYVTPRDKLDGRAETIHAAGQADVVRIAV